jgi:enoyl-CoA hydratase
MADTVTVEARDTIRVVTIDDGKVNVLGHDVLDALDGILTDAEAAGEGEVGALVITGRPGVFSGGFDLKVMMQGPQQAGELVTKGGALFTRMFGSPVPIVAACTGHAIAAGALLMMSTDERVAAAGEFQIGLIETAKGMVLPRWAIELAEERLSRRHFQVATVGARMYPPDAARDAGLVDEVVDPARVLDRALDIARVWAGLPRAAYRGQVTMNRGSRLERLTAAVDADRGARFAIDS